MTTTLAELTTFRVGGPIASLIDVEGPEALAKAVHDADQAGTPLLVLGGGSNLLASDAGFHGVVVRDRSQSYKVHEAEQYTPNDDQQLTPSGSHDSVLLTATAGTVWDDLVAFTVREGLSGLEFLSGIPGSVGAAPVQNVGAYGSEVAHTLVSVRAWDRLEARDVEFTAADLDFSYRHSILKDSVVNGSGGRHWGPTGRWVVLSVTFRLERSPLSAPVRYAEVARRLGVDVGERISAETARSTVLELRTSKGMVLDEADHDTWSAGSFFTNPIISPQQAATLPEDAPRFPAGEGMVKTSAAWLIDHAGFPKGWAVPAQQGNPSQPRASLSTKHVLALTNRGGASAADIETLARAIRDGVQRAFGVTLVPEPVALGITW
ncbi:MAG: UDP-N-acetylmuramate dehydrogenase [Actinomycetaceae bacterium]|nr:UDP-N-acetylmuramate dehydrogenase [Actinomycetaceae bacterium]